MTIYARVDAGVVQEVVDVPAGTAPLSERYTADIAAQFVPVPFALGRQVAPGWLWDGAVFAEPTRSVAPPPKRYVPVSLIRERLEAARLWDEMAALLWSLGPVEPALVVKLLTLGEGIAQDDEKARTLLQMIGADPDAILA